MFLFRRYCGEFCVDAINAKLDLIKLGNKQKTVIHIKAKPKITSDVQFVLAVTRNKSKVCNTTPMIIPHQIP